jgi:D-3-phosphoglycerate dehydrogenase
LQIQKNIQYESSPDGIANSVAEHITGMLLSLNKNIHTSFEEIKNKQWTREPNRGIELENHTIGIIGYGHTGSAFAKKMSVFTKSILAYDKNKTGLLQGVPICLAFEPTCSGDVHAQQRLNRQKSRHFVLQN